MGFDLMLEPTFVFAKFRQKGKKIFQKNIMLQIFWKFEKIHQKVRGFELVLLDLETFLLWVAK